METQTVNAETIPDDLKNVDRWVGWKWDYSSSQPDAKWTKIPIRIDTGGHASSMDPSTWASWQRVYESYKNSEIAGVGFVLSPDDNICGIDLDHVRDIATGEIENWASKIVDMLNSYTEVSPSGAGLRIFLKGNLPEGRRKRSDIEAYEKARFLTVTGQCLPDAISSIAYRQVEVAQFHAEYLADDEETEIKQNPIEFDEDAPASDYAILRRVFESVNGDRLRQLYEGFTSGYPSHSEADMALCSAFVFWTQNFEQIDRLFRGSGLYREKWDQYRGEDTYGVLTIKHVLQTVDAVFLWDIHSNNQSLNDKIQRFLKFGLPKAKRN